MYDMTELLERFHFQAIGEANPKIKQVRAVAASAGLPADGFAAAKLLHGALAALLTAALFRLSPAALAATSPGAAMPPLLRPMPAALLAFAALFAIWGGKQAKNKV